MKLKKIPAEMYWALLKAILLVWEARCGPKAEWLLNYLKDRPNPPTVQKYVHAKLWHLVVLALLKPLQLDQNCAMMFFGWELNSFHVAETHDYFFATNDGFVINPSDYSW